MYRMRLNVVSQLGGFLAPKIRRQSAFFFKHMLSIINGLYALASTVLNKLNPSIVVGIKLSHHGRSPLIFGRSLMHGIKG